MVFTDAFIHGDLHPGNMFWKINPKTRQPELIYLDCGLAIELNERDSTNFADVVYSIIQGRPEDAGRLIVDRSPGEKANMQEPELFVDKVADLIADFRKEGKIQRRGNHSKY